MKQGYFCVFIAVFMLLALGAIAGEPADKPEKILTLEEKVKKAHELVGVGNSKPKQELLGLIHDVGVADFLKPVIDDEAKLLEVFEEIMHGSTSTEGSMTRADIATYLLKDERPKVRDEALKQMVRLALYCDKPYVSDLLFEMYREAKDDADLRLRVARAFCFAGSPNPEGKEPNVRPKLNYDKSLRRFQTLFRDPDPKVRRAVVENLRVDEPTSAKSGIGILEADTDAGVRAVVIDYYRRSKVKSKRVVAMALNGLKSTNFEEIENSVRYCTAMKLDESREPMFALTKRYAGSTETGAEAAEAQRLKFSIIGAAIQLEWKKATPDLIWMTENDADRRVRTRAAYGVLALAGQTTVRLGTVEEEFSQNMVEAETPAMMSAFKAWVIRSHEGKGETPEVRRLEEEAQIEFSDKVYEIAKRRIADRDIANKRRGLELVIEIGPEEFAKEVATWRELNNLIGSLLVFQRMHQEVEANRQLARLMLAFTGKNDIQMRMTALQGLVVLAPYCDKDVFMPVMSKLLADPDRQIVALVEQAGKAINKAGYSGRQERMREERGYKEGPAEPEGN